jgi:adhesin/invasin
VVSNVVGSIPGLTIPTLGSNSLAIVGTPTATGSISFTVAATDSAGMMFSRNYTLTVTTADPSKSTVSLMTSNVVAGGTTTITLTAMDASGERESSGGLAVAFGLGSGTGTGTFGPVTDNGDGTYQTVFTGTMVGGNTITATIDGQPLTTAAPAMTVSPGAVDPTMSTISSLDAALPVGGTTTVTLTARDAFGNDESAGGLIVTFGLDTAVGSFSQVTDNGDGTYSASFTATGPGTASYQATIDGQTVRSLTAGVTVLPLSLAQSTVTVSTMTLAVGGTATATLTVKNADGTQESTGGLAVSFYMPYGAGSGTFGPVTDEGNGTYTATFTAKEAGYVAILATIDDFPVVMVPTITVAPLLQVTGNPTSQVVTVGSAVSFVAAAAGGPVPDVQWQVSTNGGTTFSNISGATSTTLTFTPTLAQSGDQYVALFTSTVGTATTAAATLTVNAVQTATLSLSGLTFTYDGTAHAATVVTDPAGLAGVTIVYSQNGGVIANPTQPGTYLVTVTLDNLDYTAASVTGTLVISPAMSTPSPVATPPPVATPSVIIAEQPLFQRKAKKKGKAALIGFTLDFGVPLNSTAASNVASYHVFAAGTTTSKKKKGTSLIPITNFSVSYMASNDSVAVTFGAAEAFPAGGQITILGGLTTTAGGTLTGPANFTIAKGGKSIGPS